ncbi:protein FAM200C-like [Watersipora subatra]|uniref:protein FAM200C-like n=1 Tax=Watersipora subatra TaxID=2589382 RepID=UPI00355C7356
MASVILGAATEVKLSHIPLSNVTNSNRIEDMSKDILAQVVADLISSPAKFSLQLGETTDLANPSQLAVFACAGNKNLVNYVRTSFLRHRSLSELCKEMGAEFEMLLYHSNVPWLSREQFKADLFAALNHLNQQMQGAGVIIIKAEKT